MARERETRVVVRAQRKERFALSSVVSEESLVEMRELVLGLTLKRKGETESFERALWRNRAWRALRGERESAKHIDRLLYGWVDKDTDFEQRLMGLLGVSLDTAREAVKLFQMSEHKDPHTAALAAANVLEWYARTQRPMDERVSDAIKRAARACDTRTADAVVDEGPDGTLELT